MHSAPFWSTSCVAGLNKSPGGGPLRGLQGAGSLWAAQPSALSPAPHPQLGSGSVPLLEADTQGSSCLVPEAEAVLCVFLSPVIFRVDKLTCT